MKINTSTLTTWHGVLSFHFWRLTKRNGPLSRHKYTLGKTGSLIWVLALATAEQLELRCLTVSSLLVIHSKYVVCWVGTCLSWSGPTFKTGKEQTRITFLKMSLLLPLAQEFVHTVNLWSWKQAILETMFKLVNKPFNSFHEVFK